MSEPLHAKPLAVFSYGEAIRRGRTAQRRVQGPQVGGIERHMNYAERKVLERAIESWKKTQREEERAEGRVVLMVVGKAARLRRVRLA